MNKLQKMKQELDKQLELLQDIEILKENKWGNTVRIGDKVFSFLRPEPNDEDVFSGPEGSRYEHVRYIRGDKIEKYLGNKQMFADKDAFEEFVENNIPGKNRKIKLQNYAGLMGLELSGCRAPGGGFANADVSGSDWVSRSVGGAAYVLKVHAGGADADWYGLKFAQPVIVFTNSKDMNKLQKMKQELEKHLKLLENIEIFEENEWGNTVRIGDKVFSFLRPEPNGKDVFKGEGKYEHVRYIRGDAMEKYLGNKQMFAGKEDFESFIEENIPGKKLKTKLQNYVDLMGLELSGYRLPGWKFFFVDDYGYAWVSRSNGNSAYELEVDADGADTGWIDHDCAQPVIVFTASE